MKVYTTICIIFGLLLFSSIAQGQITYKKYMHPKSPYQLDRVCNSATNNFISNSTTNHLWLITLSGQYIDTTTNKINAAAFPAYVPLKKNSLSNPNSAVNQIIGAALPYAYYSQFPPYSLTTYNPANRQYNALPYGYSPYNVRAPSSPYFLSTKF